jgi:2',3'-cyclic-nucleotide 2'-phosphodiesterase (5'-nucleotidase family)
VVVAVTHIGFGADEELAREVDGIDVILGAHTHTSDEPRGVRVRTPSGGETLVCQAGEYLKFLGEAELKLELSDGKYKLVSATEKLIPIDDKVKLDPTVTAAIAKMSETGKPASRPAPVRAGAK